jgi:3-methyladenine DNA glycosylase/8-oxoguanine DNA glycosylase
MTAEEVEESLEPFRPFRGLAMFYFIAHWRLSKLGRMAPPSAALP